MTVRPMIALIIAVLGALMAEGEPAFAADFTVTKTADTADGACDADCSLREAVIAANAAAGDDTITLPAGTYSLTIVGGGENNAAAGDLDISFDALTIEGAGAATTIIEVGAGQERVFEVVNGSASISGVTIRNGQGEVGSGCECGGGILVRAGTVFTLTDSVVSGNTAVGGIVSTGGGIHNDGTLTISGSTIGGNSADLGGGIYSVGTLTVSNSTLSANTTTGSGGAIVNDTGGSITLSDVTLGGNQADGGGGAILNVGDAAFTGVTFSGNQSGGSGGAFSHNGGLSMPTFTNVTFSGNQADGVGGGISTQGGLITLTNVTLAENSANDALGGGNLWINPTGSIELVNTIIAFAAAGGDCAGTLANLTSLGHNANVDGTCNLAGPGDFANAILGLGLLADNGGPTQTHALTPIGCPSDACLPPNDAVDGGDTLACPATDQRGEPRPFDGDGDGALECDIGAFELQEPPFTCPAPCGVVPATPTPSPAQPVVLPPTGGGSGNGAFPLIAALATVPAIALAGVGLALCRRALRRD